jgi:fumarate reductase (CoM/CoB) subunit B
METMNCKPLNSIYCNLKVKLTGNLNDQDLDGLYNCTLCNHCGMAGFNLGAREIAVNKNIVISDANIISRSIRESGNPYGIVKARSGEGPSTDGTILFRGCTPTFKTPDILSSVEKLLKQKGIKYGFMDNETCCGSILFGLGDRRSGSDVVRRNIEKFKAAGVKRIITICPGCYDAFNKYYRDQDGFNPEVILAVDLMDGMAFGGEGLVIQDPCHAKEKSTIVRKILPGAGNKSASSCCGAGSGLMMHNRQLADAKARATIGDHHMKVVTYCPFCYLNLVSVKPESVVDIYMLLDSSSGEKKASA